MSTAESKEVLNMDQVKVDPRWALRIPGNLAMRRRLLPFTMEGNSVLVACTDLSDSQGLQAVERYLDVPVVPNLAEESSLERAINRIFREPIHSTVASSAPARIRLEAINADGEVAGDEIVGLGDEIFNAALIQGATDIHIEPLKKETAVRFRVDGVLEEYRRIPATVHNPLVSRIKVLSGMDIAERRAPQDGRFTLGREETRLIDVRSATLPTKRGERMTLRLLASHTRDLTLEKLGMKALDLEVFQASINRPNGLILLTGPTGCGKSTTLYAAIRQMISDRMLNVITIEDPVEYVIDEISQVEVDTADKVNFHKALRSGLRHDPDVLMIGEIRDATTAEIAIKAALTGHLVFSTLHTNSAASSITRLIDMGIEPFLVSAVSRLFVAQRLVRTICQHCRRPTQIKEAEAAIIKRPDLVGTEIFESPGCKYCAGSGYVGRTGLFELLPIDLEFAELTTAGASEQLLQQTMHDRKIDSLFDDGFQKLKDGITSFDEIATVVNLY